MSSCPWLNARCPAADEMLGALGHHIMAAADAVEDGLAAVSDEARANPKQALLIAGAAGLVLGLILTSRRR
ncbi:hypothetical protein [Acidisoma sp. 7E03]